MDEKLKKILQLVYSCHTYIKSTKHCWLVCSYYICALHIGYMRKYWRIAMAKLSQSKPLDTTSDVVPVVHNVPTEVDNLVQTQATLGDKVAKNAGDLLELYLPFMPASYRDTKPEDRKPTWYADQIKGLFNNLLKDKAYAKRFTRSYALAYDLNYEVKVSKGEVPEVKRLTKHEKSGNLMPTKGGEDVDLVTNAETCMAFTKSEVASWTTKAASNPKSAHYQKYGISYAEHVKPVRTGFGDYKKGAFRDLRTALTKALKKACGVASNVASAPDIITDAIPKMVASIVKRRNLSTDNGFKWSAQQTRDFNQGIALIEKSCK